MDKSKLSRMAVVMRPYGYTHIAFGTQLSDLQSIDGFEITGFFPADDQKRHLFGMLYPELDYDKILEELELWDNISQESLDHTINRIYSREEIDSGIITVFMRTVGESRGKIC